MKKFTLLTCLFLFFNLSFAWSQTLFNDDFNGTEINSGWILKSPNPASQIILTDSGELLLQASASNGGSDLWSGSNYNAPRILQAVDTANHNWMVETKLKFKPTADYQGAGIGLHRSPDVNDSTATMRIIEKKFYPNGGGLCLGGIAPEVLYTDSVVYFRCERSSDSIRVWYSQDSINWHGLGSIVDRPIYYVGFFCLRQPWAGSTSLNSYAYFDYFKFTSATVGIDNIISQEKIITYPNPFINQLLMKGTKENGKIILYNFLGKEILKQNAFEGETKLNTERISSGFYLLRYIDKKSEVSFKVIKQ